MSADFSSEEKFNLLFKKLYGAPFAFPLSNYVNDFPVASRPSIFPTTQIYTDEIPVPCPNDLSGDNSFSSTIGIRKYSKTKNYIVKYENIKLSHIVPKRSYNFVNTNLPNINLLKNSIPFNYDSNLSYDIIIRLDNPTTGDIIIKNGENNGWVIDNDAGILTFIRELDSNRDVYITFWRYEGRFGFPGAPTFLLDGGRPNTDFSKAGGFDSGRI